VAAGLHCATINGCGVVVGHEYLGFNRQYLAALIPNLNVFYTLPIWQSGVKNLGLMPRAVLRAAAATQWAGWPALLLQLPQQQAQEQLP
jgi:hypothetical protein